jgi:hypothetical protein
MESRYSEAGVDATRSMVERRWCPEVLVSAHVVLTEEAYARAPVSSPYRNADEDMVPGTGAIDPESAGGGAVPGDGVMGHPIGILPSAKLILHRSSVRKSVSASD